MLDLLPIRPRHGHDDKDYRYEDDNVDDGDDDDDRDGDHENDNDVGGIYDKAEMRLTIVVITTMKTMITMIVVITIIKVMLEGCTLLRRGRSEGGPAEQPTSGEKDGGAMRSEYVTLITQCHDKTGNGDDDDDHNKTVKEMD